MRRALLCASLALAAACQRDPARPARDAVQEAFREGGLTARQAFGHRLFVARCATCHGALGRGDGQNAYNLDPAPPDFQSSLTRLPLAARRRLIEDGSAAIGRSPLCPPRGRALQAEEVDAILDWLEVASRPTVTDEESGPPRWRRRVERP